MLCANLVTPNRVCYLFHRFSSSQGGSSGGGQVSGSGGGLYLDVDDDDLYS